VKPTEVVSEFWRRIQARDWDGLGQLLADDFVVDMPNTRLRIRGRTNFVGFNREYPEGWRIEVLAILAGADTVVSEVRVPHSELGTFYVLSILEVEGDRIHRGREYWLDEQQQQPPDDRAHWFEPI